MKKLRKSLIFLIIFAFVLSSASLPLITKAKNNYASGSLIKGKGHSTVYFLGDDGKRHVFPNANIYFSWYNDFGEVQEVDDNVLSDYSLGDNVQYKPGAILIKIKTDPKVYAVGVNGALRWIKNEAIARALYGTNWYLLIDDVPDSLFADYAIGEDIDDEDEYEPEEEEEGAPEINYNFGFRKRIEARIEHKINKTCTRLEKSVNKLQKRLARWGMELPDVGDDFVAECVEKNNNNSNNKKTTICHREGNGGEHTIGVSNSAVKAHLKHGDYIGACEGDDDGEENDTTAPVINDVNAEVAESSVKITWTTDEESDSRVEYGLDTLSATSTTVSSKTNSSMVTSHEITLEVSSDLTASTTYYFIVKSKDGSGNEAESAESTFTTEPEPVLDTTAPIISGISVVASSTFATIEWTTDEAATSKITYADESLSTASTTEEISDSNLVTGHSLEITGLATSTQYFFMIESKDSSDNTATSTEQDFTTL